MTLLKLKANLSIINYQDLSCRSSEGLIDTDSIIKLHALMNPLSTLDSQSKGSSILLNLPPSESDASSSVESSHDNIPEEDKQETKEKLYFSHLLLSTILETLRSVYSKQCHARIRGYLYRWRRAMQAEKSRERSKQMQVYYRIKQSCTMINQIVTTHLNKRIIRYFYTWRAQAQVLKLHDCINDIKIEANRKYSFFFRTLSSQVNGLYSKQHLLESEIEEHTLREQKYATILKKLKSRTSTSPRVSLGDEDILIALEHENERLKSTLAKMESDATLYFQGLSASIDRKAPQVSSREINVLTAKPARRKNNLLHLNLALF